MADLRQFRQFIAVAEEMHFRRAAERLHMAQPPLTAAIRGLEAELGVRLIERGNRVVGLTEAGRVFLEEARRAVAQAERAMQAARRAGQGLTGNLRIAFVGTSYVAMTHLLRRYRSACPDVQLELREMTSMQQVAAIRQQRVDVGFLIPPLPDAGMLSLRPVSRERLIAVLPRTHRLAGGTSARLADLAGEDFVIWPVDQGPGFHTRVIRVCNEAGFTPRIVQEAHQMQTVVALVAMLGAAALVPSAMRVTPRADIAYLDIEDESAVLDFELALAWRSDDRSPVLARFLEMAA